MSTNPETTRLLEILLKDDQLMKETVENLYYAGTDFDSKFSISYELEHWFIGMYFNLWYWLNDRKQQMPHRVMQMALDVGSLWRVEWSQLAPAVYEYASYHLVNEDLVYPEQFDNKPAFMYNELEVIA